MVIYNIQTNGASSELVIEVLNDGVYVDGGSIAYIEGDLKLDPSKSTLEEHLKSFFIGNKYFKPAFRGTGKIYLKPTIGVYHKFTIKESDDLIISDRAFIACRDTIHMKPTLKFSLAKFLSGTPLVSSHINGTGNVVVQMPGPVSEIVLNQSRFTAYNQDIAAYSSSLNITREPVGAGWVNLAHKQVYVYRGTGSIFFTPHPNKGTRPLRS